MRSSLAPQVSHEKKRKACLSEDAAVSRLSPIREPQNAQRMSPMSPMRH